MALLLFLFPINVSFHGVQKEMQSEEDDVFKAYEKKSSLAEEKETPFFFCHSLQLYSHLFLNQQFPEIPKLMRHEEVWSYEPSNFR